MKKIDFHTHYYPAKVVDKALSAAKGILEPVIGGSREDLCKSMDLAGISLSVGLPLVNTPSNSKGVNNWAVKECYGNIHCLGSIHPDEENPFETLKFIADNGLCGIKIHPEYQFFEIDSEKLYPIWERCIDLGLFVLTHAGYDVMFKPPFKSNPKKILKVHEKFPELKLVAAHLGSMRMWNDVEESLIGKDIYFDLAFIKQDEISSEQLLRIIRKHGSKKILFGSDSPWCSQLEISNFIESLPLTTTEKEDIFFRNAEELLKL